MNGRGYVTNDKGGYRAARAAKNCHKMSVRLILLNLGLENQDISEAIVGITAPPLCSSKGGTAHGEQERNFKLVIRGQKRKEPNGHSSGK